MDTQGILYNSHRCSYLDLVMSQICCENKSKKVNSDNKHDIRPRARTFCPLYSLSEVQSRSTYYLGHRWLCSWLWRTGILGNQFAANRKHNRAEQRYEWKQVKMVSLVSSQTLAGTLKYYSTISRYWPIWNGENDKKKTNNTKGLHKYIMFDKLNILSDVRFQTTASLSSTSERSLHSWNF